MKDLTVTQAISLLAKEFPNEYSSVTCESHTLTLTGCFAGVGKRAYNETLLWSDYHPSYREAIQELVSRKPAVE